MRKQKYDYPRAVVREISGRLVLDDPDALEMIRAIGKVNCANTLKANTERIAHFKNRLSERGLTPDKAVIVVINVNNQIGSPLADALMPGFNWEEIRQRGEVPFARGLALRAPVQEYLGIVDKEAAEKLLQMKKVAVVVIDHEVAEVYKA